MTKQATLQIKKDQDNPLWYDVILVTADTTGELVSSVQRQFRQEDSTDVINHVCGEAEDNEYTVKFPDDFVFGE